MHFCQSQFEYFLPEDSSCILESDLDTLSSSRLLQLQLNITRQKAALLAAQKKLSRFNRGKCNRSKWVRDSLQPFIFLCPLSQSLCFLCTGCHPLFLNPWPPFVAPFDLPSLLSSLCPLSGSKNKVGLFVQLVATSLIL